MDAAGNLFIADSGNQVIRKVSPVGVITTVAGTGTAGYGGDGGPAIAATLNVPASVAVDAASDLFIADSLDYVVREIAAGLRLTVTTTNQPPVLTATANQMISQGSTIVLTAQATDPDPGETLTFSLDPGAPAGAAIDPRTGAFSWTVPTTQPPGDYPVTVRVTNNGNPPLSATQTFTIHVFALANPPGDHPPSLAAIANPTVVQGGTVTITAQATDPDPGQTLTFSLDPGAPAGAVIYPGSGVFSWAVLATQAPGDYPVTVRVIDNGIPPLSAAQTYTIHITPTPTPTPTPTTTPTPTPTSTPAPIPTPPHATGVVSVGHSKKGITSIMVAFDEALDSASLGNMGLYSVLGGVKKRKRLVYSKVVGIRGTSYNDNTHTVTINLAKPYKGAVQVTVHGGIVATNGASSSGDFTRVVQ